MRNVVNLVFCVGIIRGVEREIDVKRLAAQRELYKQLSAAAEGFVSPAYAVGKLVAHKLVFNLGIIIFDRVVRLNQLRRVASVIAHLNEHLPLGRDVAHDYRRGLGNLSHRFGLDRGLGDNCGFDDRFHGLDNFCLGNGRGLLFFYGFGLGDGLGCFRLNDGRGLLFLYGFGLGDGFGCFCLNDGRGLLFFYGFGLGDGLFVNRNFCRGDLLVFDLAAFEQNNADSRADHRDDAYQNKRKDR